MAFGAMCRVAGLSALALTPLGAAAVLVTAFSRDPSETASAVVAAAAGLSLLGFLQLASLTRQTRRLDEKQDELRAQALALAGCMKMLNTRLLSLQPEQSAQPDWPPVTSILLADQNGSDLPKSQSERLQPIEVLPLVAPAGGGLWGWEIGRLSSTLSRFSTGHRAMLPDLALCGRIRRAAELLPDREGRMLVMVEAAVSQTPRAMALAASLAAENQDFRARFVLGIAQRQIQGSAAAAGILATLARHGVALVLTDVTDFRIDPGTLAACGICAVRIDAGRLIGASGDELTAAATLAGDLGRVLGHAGVALLCDGVLDRSALPVLARIGVAAASGPALQGAGEIVTFPWRAAPMPPAQSLPDVPELRRAG